MAKEDVVAAQKAALLAAEDSAIDTALSATYDAAVADQPPVQGGGLTQADVDAAVAAAVTPLNEQLAAVQQALVDMTAKEQMEEGVVSGLKGAIDQMQASLDAIKSFQPAV